MQKIKSHKLRSLVAILILLATTMPLFAQQPTLDKNDEGYYVIKTDADYETFRRIVGTGNPYANAVLENDINVTHSIGEGDEQFHYRGTFDGQGHTVNLNISLIDKTWKTEAFGMFTYTKPGCVIRNLRVTGKIGTNATNAGGVVGDATDTRIENCISEVFLSWESRNHGGLIGVAHGVCYLENCAAIGDFTSGDRHADCENCASLVGDNAHSVSIKSCYTAVKQHFDERKAVSVFTNRLSEHEVHLNNFYCHIGKEMTSDNQHMGDAQEVNKDDLESGKLCYLLNQGGKKGVVWYQHDKRPWPFKGTDGKLVTSQDRGETVALSDDCSHNYLDGHICPYCGAIESGYRMEPLQVCEENVVDNIKYKIITDIDDNGKQKAYVDGLVDNSAKAVHIPATVTLKGISTIMDITVTGINEGAFAGSSLEYIYIPNTVNTIGDLFKDCTSLKYLHIADSPDPIEFTSSATFTDAPLEKVYVGRNMSWSLHKNSPFEFCKLIKEYIWGPEVTTIGNVDAAGQVDAHGIPLNIAFFSNTWNLSDEAKVYFMGSEKSLGKTANVPNISSFHHIKDYYINRDIEGYISTPHGEPDAVLFANCEKVAFGPFVKRIVEHSFARDYNNVKNADYYRDFNEGEWSEDGHRFSPLKKLDIANAFNLEEIGKEAFMNCKDLDCPHLELSQTKLKSIGEGAFSTCHNIRCVELDDSLKTIGDMAFFFCKRLADVNIPASVETIGKYAFKGIKDANLHLEIADSDNELDLSNLQFGGATHINECYLGRNIITDHDGFKSTTECIWKIGPKVTKLDARWFNQKEYKAMYLLHSDAALHYDEQLDFGVQNITLDRVMECDKEQSNLLPYKDNSKTRFINIGSNISEIPDNMFAGSVLVTFLIVPSNIKEIGTDAFRLCRDLAVVSVMGKTNIRNEAFVDCPSISYLYLMNDSITLGDHAFTGSNAIKEVSTTFTEDPKVLSSASAFGDTTYDEAYLSTADDWHPVEFTTAPWSKFKKKGTIHALQDVFDGSQNMNGDYNKATAPCGLKEGQFSLIYLPFELDSYFFGATAEVYHLKTSGDNYVDNTTTTNDHFVDNVEFEKVDLDEQKTLALGETYLVKPVKDIETMGAYFSFYETDHVTVNSDNSEKSSSESNISLRGEKDSKSDWEVYDNKKVVYTVNDGVVEVINGDYTTQPYELLFSNYQYDMTPSIAINLMNGETEVVTSKKDLTFNGKLEGYSSFYAADHNYVAPDWCNVFVVTSTLDNNVTIEEIADRTITKGQAVLIKSSRELNGDITEYLTYATNGSSETSLYGSNLLKGVDKDTLANQLSPEGFVYVLSCSASGTNTGFYKLSGERVMPAGKAYLAPDGLDKALLARACLFVCDETVTGITMPDTDNANVKSVYDMMGRRLREAGYKGIYIINNKKVLK